MLLLLLIKIHYQQMILRMILNIFYHYSMNLLHEYYLAHPVHLFGQRGFGCAQENARALLHRVVVLFGGPRASAWAAPVGAAACVAANQQRARIHACWRQLSSLA